ncbi:MAG: hypothetical protein E7665_05025 [Ruminococcaceae bacterium]|nr:hypothetical protein [Oscillospiraceae bacterium]
MKKRIILLAAILSVLTLFTSCVRTIPESPSSESTAEEKSAPYEPRPVPEYQKAWEYCIYENYLFSRVITATAASIKYQKLNNLQNGGFSVADNSDNNTNGSIGIGSRNFRLLADVEETNKNNGSPVLLITYGDSHYDSISKTSFYSSSIILFNTATQKSQTIKNDIKEYVWDMLLHDDIIFYLTYEADKGTVINRINKDGSGHQKMESDTPHTYRIASVHDKKLYFYADDFKEIYRCDLDFSNIEKLFEIDRATMVPFTSNGYIYYTKFEKTITINDLPQRSGSVYRRKISDLENTEELLFKNAYATRVYGDIMTYYLYDDVTGDKANSEKYNVLYAYDLKSSKDLGIIYENDDRNYIKQCYYLGDGYGCGKYRVYDKKTGNYTDDNSKTFLINIETGEETIIQW